ARDYQANERFSGCFMRDGEMVMPKLKMGGQGTIRVFLKGNEDLTKALLEANGCGPRFKGGLLDQVQAKHKRPFTIQIRQESCGRSDELLQQLDGREAPPDLERLGLGE